MVAPVEVRCPRGRGGILLKLLASGDAQVDPASNLIEVACRACRDAERRAGKPVFLVRHQFNLLGEELETEVILTGGAEV